jgi:peptide-methionine (R)-S-oxide reductase
MQNETTTMTKLRYSLSVFALIALATGCGVSQTNVVTTTTTNAPAQTEAANMSDKVTKTDEEWKKTLTSEQYYVLRQKGTERAFTGKYWNTKEAGTYKCAGCGEVLFQSDTKYDSGCGWPSFYAPNSTNVIAEAEDRSHLMVRTEVMCSKCGGHLGHVFDDGPKPTGLRYCINSASIQFEPKKPAEAKK